MTATAPTTNQGSRVIEGNRVPIEGSFQQITDLSSVTALTVPGGAKFALIQAEAEGVRWRDDGDDPTDSVGMLIEANGYIEYTGFLDSLKFIEADSGGILNVSYYK